MKKQFIVIWNKNEFVFNKFEEVVNKCEELTYGEEKHDTALIITRYEYFGDFPDVKISRVQGFRWIVDGVFELVNLNV